MRWLLLPGAFVSRGCRFVLLCLVLVVWLSGDARAQGIALKLKPVAIPPNATLDFSASVTIAEQPRVELDHTIDNGRFRYGFSVDDLAFDRTYKRYQYYYFWIASAQTGMTVRSKVTASPRGSFADHWRDVELEISEGATVDRGKVYMPVASADPLKALSVKTSGIQDVHLNGRSTVSIPVANGFSECEIEIDTTEALSADATLWHGVALKSATPQRPIRIAASAEGVIELEVVPKAFEAAQRSFADLQSDKEHATIPFKILYRNPSINGRTGELVGDVRVRFKPSLPLLALVIPIGVAFGSAMRWSWTDRVKSRAWLQGSLTALAASFVLWVVGLFLVGLHSEFKLFNYTIDPWQTLPTLVIGLIGGALGSESVDAVRRALNLSTTNQPQKQP